MSTVPASAVSKFSEPVPAATGVQMPQIQVDAEHSRYVERLALTAHSHAELGMPFDLQVNIGSFNIPAFSVMQKDKSFGLAGPSKELPVTIAHLDGRVAHLSVTPQLLGDAEFEIDAV